MIPLQAEALDISFKLIPAVIVFLMMASFLVIGYVFKVADIKGMWVAGRGIGNIENGMAIGANWMSAASYLGLAGLVALAGFYGLAFIVGWTTGYFVLLIFLAAQMRRFGKYTAPAANIQLAPMAIPFSMLPMPRPATHMPLMSATLNT